MMKKARRGIVLSLLFLGLAGCNNPRSSSALTAPLPALTAPSPIPGPIPQPTGLQPAATAITPSTGSTGGDTWGTITGTQFESGATVRFGDGGVPRAWAFVRDSTTIWFGTTPQHAAGTVDVVVTNPGGLAGRLIEGYTYAPPGSFDFNGDWVAHAGPEFETDMRFTIRNDMLVRVSCGSAAMTLPSAAPVQNGEFSFLGDAGAAVFGKLVSPSTADGTINMGPCTAARWWADKSAVAQSRRLR